MNTIYIRQPSEKQGYKAAKRYQYIGQLTVGKSKIDPKSHFAMLLEAHFDTKIKCG